MILGNPPYNNKSKNNGKEILELLQDYKKGVNDSNIQPLNDDYIKFIRFAQWKMLEKPVIESSLFSNVDSNKYGVMGFITNNSYIWGRTHRRMRESLYSAFDEIYIINLHGDNEKDNSEDENVFNIRVGVCISIFVKYPQDIESNSLIGDRADSNISLIRQQNKIDSIESNHKVYYYSTQDNNILKRKDKFALLRKIKQDLREGQNIESVLKWNLLNVEAPYFWFIKRDLNNDEYETFIPLAEDKAMANEYNNGGGGVNGIFENYNSGIKTSNDILAIQLSESQIDSIIKDFKELDSKEITAKYNIQNPYKADWNVDKVKKDIENNQGKITPILYRPFDIQYTYYTTKQGFLARQRYNTIKHFLLGQNLGLTFKKYHLTIFDYDPIFITTLPTDINFSTGQTYIAPLYRYEESIESKIPQKILNFTQSFSDYIKKHKILKHKNGEQILAFIYATLYNPKYRQTYKEYLKIGFPRINFDVESSSFEALESIGFELMDLHLMKKIPTDSKIALDYRKIDSKPLSESKKTTPNYRRDNKQKPHTTIAKMTSPKRFLESSILINDFYEIKNVNKAVQDYTIGGYKVLEKYFSYRADYPTTYEDLQHIESICKVLEKTITLQKQLEKIEI